MTIALAVPLVPAVVIAIALSMAFALWPPLVPPLAALSALAAGALAMASVDRPRRLVWAAAGAAGTLVGLRTVVGDLPFFDLRDIPPLLAVRSVLGAPLARLIPEPEAGLALGIVLGERASVERSLIDAFNATGTTHLLAISGYNLTLVAAATALLARRLAPVPRAGLAFTAVVFYSLIVGLQPSVLRAALMAAVAALAVITGRQGTSLNALGAAIVLMLVIDPKAIGQAGFLLSVAATAGLILWQRPFAERFARLPPLLGEGLAATLAASLPTLPIIAALFGRVSLVAPLANLVAVPLFAPLLAAGAVTSAIGAVSLDAARPFGLITYAIAALLRMSVELFADVPGAAVEVPAGLGTGALLLVLIAGGMRYRHRLPSVQFSTRLSLRALANVIRARVWEWRRAVVAGLVGSVVIGAVALWPKEPLIRVLALDVGQGDAYLIQVDGAIALVDGGPDPVRLLSELGTVLPPWKRRIDLIMLTHAHLDHGAGLLAVLDRYSVGLAVDPVGLNEGALATAWAERIARAGVARRSVQNGDRIGLGGAVFEVFSPEPDPRVDVPSLVFRFARSRFTMLFTGDATDAAQADLLLQSDRLKSRIYVPPHHGAKTPHALALVQAVRPDAAVLSVGAQNRYGHPAPETLAALGAVPTYRTDKNGTVEFSSDGFRINIRTHANGLPPPRRGLVPYAPSPR